MLNKEVVPLSSCTHENKEIFMTTKVLDRKIDISACKKCQKEVKDKIKKNSFKFISCDFTLKGTY